MSSFNTNSIKGWVKKIFPNLRKTQAANLSLSVFGLVKARSGLMSVIVREIPGAFKHKHRLKRLWRFVSNPRVKPDSLMFLWVLWVVKTFVPGKYLVVALDWTELPGNIQCLCAAIPFAGRAIPLAWVTTTYRAFKDSQNRIEERLISSLTKIIPQEKRIILVADRGFGRASLVNFLISQNILFVLRVKADVIIQTKDEKKIKLRKLRIKQTKSLDRVRRIILISAVAYGLLMLVGTLTRRLTRLHDYLITGGKKAASRVWFALRIIHYQLLPVIYWKRIWLKARGP